MLSCISPLITLHNTISNLIPLFSPLLFHFYVYYFLTLKFAACFDGHGGWNVSDYSSKRLIPKLISKVKLMKGNMDDTTMDDVAISSFKDIENSYIDSIRDAYRLGYGNVANVGSCVCLAIRKDNRLTIANCGDCRAVLGSISQPENKQIQPKYIATKLSRDHNARIPLEVINLQTQHPTESKNDLVRCHIDNPSACYVKGRLQLTRSIGDLYLKYNEFNASSGNPKSM